MTTQTTERLLLRENEELRRRLAEARVVFWGENPCYPYLRVAKFNRWRRIQGPEGAHLGKIG